MDEIGQVGRAAAAPVDDVVGVQGAVSGAAGEAAAFTVDRAEQLTQPAADLA
jgi:hypothetical protein